MFMNDTRLVLWQERGEFQSSPKTPGIISPTIFFFKIPTPSSSALAGIFWGRRPSPVSLCPSYHLRDLHFLHPFTEWTVLNTGCKFEHEGEAMGGDRARTQRCINYYGGGNQNFFFFFIKSSFPPLSLSLFHQISVPPFVQPTPTPLS